MKNTVLSFLLGAFLSAAGPKTATKGASEAVAGDRGLQVTTKWT